MRNLGIVALIVAGISLVLGIISRIILKPLPILPGGGIEAGVFLDFTNTCLLAAVALGVLGKK